MLYGFPRSSKLDSRQNQINLSPMYRLCRSDCEQLLELTADLYSNRLEEGWRGRLLRGLRSLIPYEFGGGHLIQRGQRQIDPCYEPCRPPMPATSKDFWRLVEAHPKIGVENRHSAMAMLNRIIR